MVQRCEVELAESAEDDLRGILAWYSCQQVPEVGARMVVEIIEHVEHLAEFPDSGRVVPEFETAWLREVQLPPCRIVYRREDAKVTVVRLWRSERLTDATLVEDA
jgi:plasmid stabilization system protein ParE